MRVLYTILWDPHSTGDYVFYDRLFYICPDVPLNRVSELNSTCLFKRFEVFKVTFSNQL